MSTRIPMSTLTGHPCNGHDPDRRRIECTREGEFRFEQLAPDTEEESR